MPLNPAEIDRRLPLALSAAREAGNITLEFFRRDDLDVERKDDDSPVTIADRRAEECLRARIAAALPDDGIFGEEFPERPGTSGFRWILDPIDGTKSFIHGVPLYGTLIGVEHEGRSVLGVIRIPALDECVYAANGRGASPRAFRSGNHWPSRFS
jgi:fructose-1,6-bisphosphatase/inositol monophosphatase family enzyme